MGAVKSLVELRLLRKELKSQLNYHESQMKAQSQELLRASAVMLAGILLPSLVIWFFKRRKRKKEKKIACIMHR
ncbi:MAG: hypothetical protein AB7V25_10820 [Mangrovibacterium sp.]